MPGLIEDYALIGNCESAAMVGRNGSIDWLALPRFDSAACFAALLGGPENGHWQIAPKQDATVTRRYREGTLVLETRFETPDGAVALIDCMGRREGCADLVRLVRGERGRVDPTYKPNSGSWSRIASPYGVSVRLLRAGSGRL